MVTFGSEGERYLREAAYSRLQLDSQRLALIDAANQLPTALAQWGRDLQAVMVGQFQQIGAAWRQAAQSDLPREVEGAMQDCADMVLRKAQEYSSNRYFSLRELRKMGHPYAVRYGPASAGIPDFLVNYQSGRFWGSWQAAILRRSGTDYEISVTNTAPWATYLITGTKKMRQRPIIEAAFEATKEERDARLAQAVRKADP
jgi:hypothetical protein